MGAMMVVMLIGFLLLLAAIGGAIYLGFRATRRIESGVENVARELLDRRLAAGEITIEDYYEREAALRNSKRAEVR